MKKDINVYLSYHDEFEVYMIDCKELEEVIMATCKESFTETIEEFIISISDMISFGCQDDPETKEMLSGLRLNFVPDCPFNDEDESEIHELYFKALNLMIQKHDGQKDRAGKDYYFHPLRVSTGCILDSKVVALLHDVLEDTNTTANNLLNEGFPHEIVDAVVAITRVEGETYAQFLKRCAQYDIAKEVKWADLEDNMDITRLEHLTEKDLKRLNKYLHAWRYLNGFEEDWMLIEE